MSNPQGGACGRAGLVWAQQRRAWDATVKRSGGWVDGNPPYVEGGGFRAGSCERDQFQVSNGADGLVELVWRLGIK